MQRLSYVSLTLLTSMAIAGWARPAAAETMVAVSKVGAIPVLLTFDTEDSLLPQDVRPILGLNQNEKIVAIDQRPATGEIMAVGVDGNSASLYSISPDGLATAIGEPFTGLDNPAGTRFGFDFNPTIDRVRLVSTVGQNLVFNPEDGAVTEATNLFYEPDDPNEGEVPAIAQIAYDNNVDGAEVTLQRGIDIDLGALVTVANNDGNLATIGSLGVDVQDIGGFDISGETGIGYAILTESNGRLPILGFLFRKLRIQLPPIQRLYTVDLDSGEVTSIGVPALSLLDLNGLTIVQDTSESPDLDLELELGLDAEVELGDNTAAEAGSNTRLQIGTDRSLD